MSTSGGRRYDGAEIIPLEIRKNVLFKLFEKIAEYGVAKVNLLDIAHELDMDIYTVYLVCPSKYKAFEALTEYLNIMTVNNCELTGNKVERLFEVIMARLEVAAPFKKGMINFWKEIGKTVNIIPNAVSPFTAAVTFIGDLASIWTNNPAKDAILFKALSITYFRTFYVWGTDDSSNGKTMAMLSECIGKIPFLKED